VVFEQEAIGLRQFRVLPAVAERFVVELRHREAELVMQSR
jgi:hypothetical protein